MNNASLKEFASSVVVLEVGRQLSDPGIDATMLISIALRQAITHYRAYQAELMGISINTDQIIARLSDVQQQEVKLSKNKQVMLTAIVQKELADFKKVTAGIIDFLERNQQQVDSASPSAQLRLKNLLRQEQGLKPLKRLPKDTSLAPKPLAQAA